MSDTRIDAVGSGARRCDSDQDSRARGEAPPRAGPPRGPSSPARATAGSRGRGLRVKAYRHASAVPPERRAARRAGAGAHGRTEPPPKRTVAGAQRLAARRAESESEPDAFVRVASGGAGRAGAAWRRRGGAGRPGGTGVGDGVREAHTSRNACGARVGEILGASGRIRVISSSIPATHAHYDRIVRVVQQAFRGFDGRLHSPRASRRGGRGAGGRPRGC